MNSGQSWLKNVPLKYKDMILTIEKVAMVE